jgi:hypothetical protein
MRKLKLSSKMGRLPSLHALSKLAQWEGLEVVNDSTSALRKLAPGKTPMDSSSDEEEEVEVVQVVFSDGGEEKRIEDEIFVCQDNESIEI